MPSPGVDPISMVPPTILGSGPHHAEPEVRIAVLGDPGDPTATVFDLDPQPVESPACTCTDTSVVPACFAAFASASATMA